MTRAIPGIPIEQQSARWLYIATLWGEARGEPTRGKLAVGWVIRNRSRRRNQAIQEVCLAPKQFSCWNPDDPNRSKMLAAYDTDPGTWGMCEAVVDLIDSGDTMDPTTGADHYFAHQSIAEPSWAARMKVTAEIGRHRFLIG